MTENFSLQHAASRPARPRSALLRFFAVGLIAGAVIVEAGVIIFAIIGGLFGKPFVEIPADFVLFAEQEIILGQNSQVANGNLGSNNALQIMREGSVRGNLFADRIILEQGTIINGNISYNSLIAAEETTFGTHTQPLSLSPVKLPAIPKFQAGNDDLTFSGTDNVLMEGSYRSLTVQRDSILRLAGGTYAVNELILQERSGLIFAAPTIFNIQQELRGQDDVFMYPDQNIAPDDLQMHYTGRNVRFGANVFLNLKLLAPSAEVRVGENSTLRGQILARAINFESNALLSNRNVFIKPFDPQKVVETEEGRFPADMLLVNFVDSAAMIDARTIAQTVNGRIIGFLRSINAYQIEVSASTPEELAAKIQTIESLGNPLVEGVLKNYLFEVNFDV